MNNMIELGMFLAMVLRHKPDTINITLDEHGWTNVEDLIDGFNNAGYKDFDMKTLETLVDTDNKKRYSFNEDKTLIRANQGHSVPVDVEPYKLIKEDIDDLTVLYHGTSSRFTKSIDKNGIKKMDRNFVQLSHEVETASMVGNRHNRKIPGKLVIYVINIHKMFEDGLNIYRSANGVYLVDYIDPKYFINKIEES